MGIRTRHDRRIRPTLRHRLRELTGGVPGARLLFLRRVAAVALIVMAAVLATGPPHGSASRTVDVLVATRDLAPGVQLRPGDVTTRRASEAQVPNGALREPSAAHGRVLAAALRRGTPLTDVSLVDAALTELTTGSPDHVAVAIRLADPAVAALLHPGKRVDLISSDPHSGQADVLAEFTPVIASGPSIPGREQGRLLLVAVPEQRAAAVAGASMTQSVTVTLH